MSWILSNLPAIGQLTWLHLVQSVLPVLAGLLISIPIARLAISRRGLGERGSNKQGRTAASGKSAAKNVRRGLVINSAALLYTIPSLALFVLMPIVLGTSITSVWNVLIALTLYVIAMMVRSAVDAFDSVPTHVLESATAMGYRPLARFWKVELPLSIPVMAAGLRVALVSNISMVSVGAVIGIQSLGTLFTDGLRRNIPAEIIAGILATVVLALILDRLVAFAANRLTTWRNA